MYLRRSLLEPGVLCCTLCGHREREDTRPGPPTGSGKAVSIALERLKERPR